MEMGQLERELQIAIQNVIMSEKMVEQAKAKVANIEGRIFERKDMQAKAKVAKKTTSKKK